MAQRKAAPLVGVVMGSDSDWEVMRHAVAQLDAFAIPNEPRVLSAHRMPDDMFEYAEDAAPRGLRVIIAGAGGAAHLPGMLAAKTTIPILGRAGAVEVPSRRGFAAVDRADAQRHSGGDVRDRRGRAPPTRGSSPSRCSRWPTRWWRRSSRPSA